MGKNKPSLCHKIYNLVLSSLTIDFFKKNFLNYKSEKISYSHHEDLEIDDDSLNKFMSLLSININAKEYEDQRLSIVSKLKETFSCDDFYAEYGLYNNSLNEVRKLAIQNDLNLRRISKKNFLSRIDTKDCLFNSWFLELKGKKEYHARMRNEYFRSVLNKTSIERFFIIEIPEDTDMSELKDVVRANA